MQLNTYLFLDGQCEEAFTRYQQILGGEITAMIRHAGTPAEAQVPPEWRDKIMHVCLNFGERQSVGSSGRRAFRSNSPRRAPMRRSGFSRPSAKAET